MLDYFVFCRNFWQFLCVCMAVLLPQGGLGDRHLVTVPQGVAGGRLPWGGEGQRGARVRLCFGVCACTCACLGVGLCCRDDSSA